MLKRFAMTRSLRHRWLYPLISITVTLSILLSSTVASWAIPLPELIFRGVQIIQLSNLSARQEVAIGEQINEELLTKQVKLFRNPEAQNYINQIGQRLAQASDRPNLPYTFQVIEDRNINAFATMGGFVYIHTGLIAAADNEAELASVIAHEIGHIGGRHAIKQMRQAAVAAGVATVAGVDRNKLVQIGVELALNRPKSREAEYEADRMGLATLIRAGYAPRGAVDFMAKLLKSGSPPTIISTHPATRDRISAMQQLLDPSIINSGDGLDSNSYRATVERILS
ncbi:Putative beta-barrel assembly-enhancing protease [Planktothrix tepida]|uniref:Putative zinc metallopeptidase, M48 family n=1 Tax=Planktothrix tepida PCC 9214 TaxID=671072 RepID=A0A1J1LIR9_9CYAN|nr:M48 family metallopeptidase [Planktothrix tepida]CAD5947631.1 Putative beta-barrel assembly-enhancing protease [Planktothrix tepida]CUR32395.1 putative zinc metallopeptidase, M48 family [Planktothrix tepida PCC 9214]